MRLVTCLWQYDFKEATNFVWLIDNRCSNHMFGGWDLFNVLDETQKLSISLGNDKEIKAEDVGTVVLDI